MVFESDAADFRRGRLWPRAVLIGAEPQSRNGAVGRRSVVFQIRMCRRIQEIVIALRLPRRATRCDVDRRIEQLGNAVGHTRPFLTLTEPSSAITEPSGSLV